MLHQSKAFFSCCFFLCFCAISMSSSTLHQISTSYSKIAWSLMARLSQSSAKWQDQHSADLSLQIDCIVHHASSLDFYCKVWGIIISSKSFSKLENLHNCQWQIIFKLATFLPNNCQHCSAVIALSLASLSNSCLAFLQLLYQDMFQKFGPE